MTNGMLALLAALTIAPVVFVEAQTRSPFEPPPMEQPPLDLSTGAAGTGPTIGNEGGGAGIGSGGAGGMGGEGAAAGHGITSDRAGTAGGASGAREPILRS
jgi:hypothetical protein